MAFFCYPTTSNEKWAHSIFNKFLIDDRTPAGCCYWSILIFIISHSVERIETFLFSFHIYYQKECATQLRIINHCQLNKHKIWYNERQMKRLNSKMVFQKVSNFMCMVCIHLNNILATWIPLVCATVWWC